MVIRTLTPELQEKAKNELGEEPSRIADDLNNIREWLGTQHHLKCRTDDQWLISFLRSSKFNIKNTKMRIDNFYRMRTLIPEFFENRDPFQSEIQEFLKAGLLLPLPICVGTVGPRIILVRFNGVSQRKINLLVLLKVYTMFLDVLLLEDDNFTIAGLFAYTDCKAYLLKKIVYCYQKRYPIRIKACHCINALLGLETIFAFMKTFMPKILVKRFFIHNKKNSKKLDHILDQKYLPQQHGGMNGDIDELTEYWKNKIESYRDWFLEDENYRSSENLRSEKPSTSEI